MRRGIVTSDRYPGYNHLAEANRRWAHLKRDFKAIAERERDSKIFGEGLLGQSKELFWLWQQVQNGILQRAAGGVVAMHIFRDTKRIGQSIVERILTVITTLRQQCRSVFDYLCQVGQHLKQNKSLTELSFVS